VPRVHEALFAWYEEHARDLPWRRTADPYAILVSEVMLQQTQVARVVPRYLEWLERWPTAAALAQATREDVLRAWVGLGYNRRALALHAAAVVVAREGWPQDLTTLPGVGPYTAAAVGSFAFGAQEVAVDTNVRRVSARLGRGTPRELLPAGRAAEFNQAMMELGATVCTARAPRCGECPVAESCRSSGAAGAPPADRPLEPGGPRRERFEDTNRWVRGRVVAALAAGEGVPADIDPARLSRALEGLERDGIVRRVGASFALG
jgi:A/G-specific adenine glycosylase